MKILLILFLSTFSFAQQNLQKNIYNTPSSSIEIGTVIAWPLENVEPNPLFWKECSQKNFAKFNKYKDLIQIKSTNLENSYLHPYNTKKVLKNAFINSEINRVSLPQKESQNWNQWAKTRFEYYEDSKRQYSVPYQSVRASVDFETIFGRQVYQANVGVPIISFENNNQNKNFQRFSSVRIMPQADLNHKNSSFSFSNILPDDTWHFKGNMTINNNGRNIYGYSYDVESYDIPSIKNEAPQQYNEEHNFIQQSPWGDEIFTDNYIKSYKKTYPNHKQYIFYLPIHEVYDDQKDFNANYIMSLGTNNNDEKFTHPDHTIVRYFCRINN